MSIRVCVAGATGWAGAAVTRQILSGVSRASDTASTEREFALIGAVARQQAGSYVGEVLGLPPASIHISRSVEEALQTPTDVLID